MATIVHKMFAVDVDKGYYPVFVCSRGVSMYRGEEHLIQEVTVDQFSCVVNIHQPNVFVFTCPECPDNFRNYGVAYGHIAYEKQ